MGINDYGGTGDALNSPPLGGPGGWAEAVAAVVDGDDTSVDARIATAVAGIDAAQYLLPAEVLAGANVTVDTVTTPGSVIVSATGGGGEGVTPWVIVAAADAPQAWKDAASYQCDGTADDVQINQAITDHAGTDGTSNTYVGQALVLLSPGNFLTSAPIDVKSRTWLKGAGRGSTLIKPASDHTAIGSDTSGLITISDPLGPPYDSMAITDLSGHGSGRDMTFFYSYFVQGDSSKDDNNLGGQPDTNNILRDLTAVSFHRHGFWIGFNSGVSGAASTSWRIDHCRAFGCGDSSTEGGAFYAGFYIGGTDCWVTNCDVGSQGDTSTEGAVGFWCGGSDNIYHGCIAWTTKGNGFVIAGAKQNLTGCNAHHSTDSGYVIENNRNILTGCLAYNNANDGFRVSANSNALMGCQSFDDGDSFTVTGRPQSTGFNLTNIYANGAGIQIIGGLTFAAGDAMIPVAGVVMDDEGDGHTIQVSHIGANQDGTSGTKQYIDWRNGIQVKPTVFLTQSEYDGLTPDPTTLYVITD